MSWWIFFQDLWENPSGFIENWCLGGKRGATQMIESWASAFWRNMTSYNFHLQEREKTSCNTRLTSTNIAGKSTLHFPSWKNRFVKSRAVTPLACSIVEYWANSCKFIIWFYETIAANIRIIHMLFVGMHGRQTSLFFWWYVPCKLRIGGWNRLMVRKGLRENAICSLVFAVFFDPGCFWHLFKLFV